MIKEAMEKYEKALQAGMKPQTIEIEGGMYYVNRNGDLDRIKTDEERLKTVPPENVNFNTLGAFADFVNENPDKFDHGRVVVGSPNAVRWFSDLQVGNDAKIHFVYASAVQDACGYNFGDINEEHTLRPWYQVEMFVIAMQSQFVQTQQVKDIIQYLSVLHNEKVVEVKDDSFNQKLHIRTGITTKGEVKIVNPVKLAPYRTFIEIDQPESNFVLRFRENNGIECALFEAGGMKWRLDAMKAIAEYLSEKLMIVPVLY